jgi:hypothetical protein
VTNWSDFLLVAKILIKHPENAEIKEALIRSSINRSYFAALCSARDFKNIQNNPPIQNSHQNALISMDQGLLCIEFTQEILDYFNG